MAPAAPAGNQPEVQFVTGDAKLTARLRQYAPRIGSFRLYLCPQMELSRASRLFVVEASSVQLVRQERGRVTIPAFAYGPPAGLATAFLRGCQNYLRDPWTPAELEHRATRWLERDGGLPATDGGEGGALHGDALHGPLGAAPLSAQEALIATALWQHRGAVVSREALFYRLWGRVPAEPSRVVDVHVAALRRKLTVVGHRPAPIETARGLGYRWRGAASNTPATSTAAAAFAAAAQTNRLMNPLLSARKVVTNTIDTIDISLMRMLMDGPEVSL